MLKTAVLETCKQGTEFHLGTDQLLYTLDVNYVMKNKIQILYVKNVEDISVKFKLTVNEKHFYIYVRVYLPICKYPAVCYG